MSAVQYHRPHPGDHFTNAHGERVTIDAVFYETQREVFRVSWLDKESPRGRRGGQIGRDGDGWRLFRDPR
jgi:hypothetical protein